MEKYAVAHSTFVIERVYPASPEKVFAAFSDPEKKRRWFAKTEGFTDETYKLDFRVGGVENSSFRVGTDAPLPAGTPISNFTTFLDIVPNHRIVMAYTMTVGEKRISGSLSTIEFVPKGKGTSLIFTEQGAFFENSDGAKMREEGWTHLLGQLAKELAG